MEYFSKDLIDFASNDYLGFSKNKVVFEETQQFLVDNNSIKNCEIDLENDIAIFHQVESAVIFKSAYDANIFFFSSVTQKNDLIFYDELCHTSIRDAIRLSYAKSYKFEHNDYEDLERLIENLRLKTQNPTTIFIVTESVFSLDGDMPNLEELTQLSGKYNCNLVIYESHSVGVFGEKGQGLIQNLQLQDKVFARIISFGNALGFEGATIIGSKELKNHIIKFERNSIYTSGFSENYFAKILVAYKHLKSEKQTLQLLRENIVYFNQEINLLGLKPMFVRSKSAIQSAIILGNQNVKEIVNQFQEKGFDVKAILSPEVPQGQERLRFCIHNFNTKEEISQLLSLLSRFIFG